MFGIDGSEFLVIILVAIIVVGPKDMPKLLRNAARMVARARRLGQDARDKFHEAMRQADMTDVHDIANELYDISYSAQSLISAYRPNYFYNPRYSNPWHYSDSRAPVRERRSPPPPPDVFYNRARRAESWRSDCNAEARASIEGKRASLNLRADAENAISGKKADNSFYGDRI